jgi:sulfate adenylyltransferase
MTHQLISPHASDKICPLLLTGSELVAAQAKAQSLPQITIGSREIGDLLMLGIGGFTPLTGFMGHDDWHGVCKDMHLKDGTFWPIPITLSTDTATANDLTIGQEIVLVNAAQEPLAILKLTEKYTIEKDLECQEVFKTTDAAHPGVAMVMSQGEVNLAGSVQVLTDGGFAKNYPGMYHTPLQVRALFEQNGWSKVAAFQTRNPMHRSHEYLTKIALEICDGVLIHSLLGQLKAGDIPANIRMQAISSLIDHHYVKDSVIQSGYPLDMRYAGPREALLHALFRQNYGCSHLIVGRDHAGVGDYYGAFDAQDIFDVIPSDALKIQPLKIDWTFWCYKCEAMASTKTCPHTADDRLLLSGTKLRKLLSDGADVPKEFSRPEVLTILQKHYAGLE